MRLCLWISVLMMALVVIFPPTVRAQTAGSVELGFDAGFEVWMFDDEFSDDVVTVSAPSGGAWILSPQGIRVGYWASESVSFEFPVGFSMLSTDGETVWGIGLGAFAVINMPAENGLIPFVKLGGRYNFLDGGFFESGEDSQWSVAGGAGVRIPLVTQLALRLGGGVERTLPAQDGEGVSGGHWDLQFEAGFSFFTSRPATGS